jgi:pimeloyl-ACP methyl ester carboxylesterase
VSGSNSNTPITLRDMGSFHVGGRRHIVSGEPVRDMVFSTGGGAVRFDPNGDYIVEQMYAQYFLVQNPRGKLPLLLWHGGGLTGVTYETKPCGNPGWLNYFLRQGWDTYVSDAMERGRSGWSRTLEGETVWLPIHDTWERFRLGPPGSWHPDADKRTAYPGVQFPLEAYEQFASQGVPRWTSTDDKIVAAYLALLDKIGPCAILVHSQSGAFGFRMAEERPDLVKAIVAVEPSAPGDAAKAAVVRNTPMLIMYCDYAKDHHRWGPMRRKVYDYADTLRAAGADVTTIDLPDIGLTGNTHMVMMDRNSDDVAAVIQKWFVTKGLAD